MFLCILSISYLIHYNFGNNLKSLFHKLIPKYNNEPFYYTTIYFIFGKLFHISTAKHRTKPTYLDISASENLIFFLFTQTKQFQSKSVYWSIDLTLQNVSEWANLLNQHRNFTANKLKWPRSCWIIANSKKSSNFRWTFLSKRYKILFREGQTFEELHCWEKSSVCCRSQMSNLPGYLSRS